MTSIEPGARVRDQEGLVGSVERVGDSTGGPAAAGAALIVRRDDGGERYAFPLRLVSAIREAEGQQFIQLDLARADLPAYRLDEAPPTSAATSMSAVSTLDAADGAQTISVPLASEELVTEIRPTERGRIAIHKGVEQVERGMDVPVQIEDVEVEHLAPDQYDPSTPAQPDEWIIPVHEERLLIRKQIVVKEYLRIRKRHVTQQVPVRDTLRREYVEVRESGPDGQPLASGTLLHEAAPDQTPPAPR